VASATVAASILILVFIGPWIPTIGPGVSNSSKEFRSVRSAPSILPIPEIVYPTEGSVLPRENAEIRWFEIASALYYEVKMTSGVGNVLWEARKQNSPVVIPEGYLPEKGEKVFVAVYAHFSDGRSTRSSYVSFTVGVAALTGPGDQSSGRLFQKNSGLRIQDSEEKGFQNLLVCRQDFGTNDG
jgi:hypothetical protein